MRLNNASIHGLVFWRNGNLSRGLSEHRCNNRLPGERARRLPAGALQRSWHLTSGSWQKNKRNWALQRKRGTATVTGLLDGGGSSGGARAGWVDVPGQQFGDPIDGVIDDAGEPSRR
jgi:hypothetical protein